MKFAIPSIEKECKRNKPDNHSILIRLKRKEAYFGESLGLRGQLLKGNTVYVIALMVLLLRNRTNPEIYFAGGPFGISPRLIAN